MPSPVHLTIAARTGKEHVPFLRRKLLEAYASRRVCFSTPLARKNRTGSFRKITRSVPRRQRCAEAHPTCFPRELSIALVGDAIMSRLHRQFMHVEGPTDVLTFPLDEDRAGRITSGEIVICVSEARRRVGGSRRGGKRPAVRLRNELLLYAIHGLLHLAGFDDTRRAGFISMHRMEDRLLSKLGIGPVFAPD